MEWHQLLKLDRLNDPKYVQHPYRPAYRQDIDRILFSQPFRRLANKTQVHPLYDNDHIHHRLIHSLEVATVGHDLGVSVGSWLADEKEVKASDVEIIAGLVQAACMAHDIGNPPFGHSGESAIGSWFADRFSKSHGVLAEIDTHQREEFIAFEGNAQGFRILTRTEMYKNEGGLRLAVGSLGAFAKYPVAASVRQQVGTEGEINGNRYIGLKKFGFFDNDIETFASVAEELGLLKTDVIREDGTPVGSWWRRHPLAFLMEAADDICYNVMDLEDAYLAGDISFDLVCELLTPVMSKTNKIYVDDEESGTVSRHRALAIKGAIDACADAFKDNYAEIMSGSFAVSLVEASRLSQEFGAIKKVAKQRIFSAPRKTELEVSGRNVIYRALDGIVPLLDDLRSHGWDRSKLSSYHVQLARALKFPVTTATNAYNALHAMTDFVSGMTDRYAVKVAEMIGR
ncbi:dGTP triphosphohydrolase [Sphingobium boeckii]|uniref:dGTPase n=1 Tax=Sphingobium boeckii TaxID=1082345 RepID=A0A7W9AG92_9SPHN|nr:dNTP triphosphohydrolase [Sphingobium boeckii]MBB5684972.1 dGTPase [Sphingobium boeckii]